MNELEINYSYTKMQKTLFTFIGVCFALYGLYQGMMLALSNTLNVDFYMALAVIVLAVILILMVTVWAPKPMFTMTFDSIFVNMPSKKSVYTADWIAVTEVGIGISYLNFVETDGKTYSVDISELKYNDLKEVKSKVIEICESKNIPYKNV